MKLQRESLIMPLYQLFIFITILICKMNEVKVVFTLLKIELYLLLQKIIILHIGVFIYLSMREVFL